MTRCEECGERIPVERLRILPWTTTCVSCSIEQPVLITQSDLDEVLIEDTGTIYSNDTII